MNKTASERPLCDPGSADGGGVCTCACLILVLCSPVLVTLRGKKVEQRINMCPPPATIIPAWQSICAGLNTDVFSSKLLS